MASMFPDPGGMPMGPPGGGMPMAPPDPFAGGPPPPGPPAEPPSPDDIDEAAVSAEDWIRVAIEAAKKAADADETDDIETQDVMKAITVLQGLLGGRQKQQEALMGGGPATKALSRAYGG